MPAERNAPGAPGQSTAALIAALAAELPPVRRLWPPYARFALWLAVEACVVVAAVLAFGFRADIATRLAGAGFAAEVVLVAAVGVASALLALLAAVPGREPTPALAAGSSVVVVAGLAFLYASAPTVWYDGGAQFVAMGWPCAVRTVAVAALPWLLLLIAVRRGATIVPGLAGLLSGSATFFIAAAAVRIACPSDERWHLVTFHLGPVALGAAASLVLGLAWLAGWRRR